MPDLISTRRRHTVYAKTLHSLSTTAPFHFLFLHHPLIHSFFSQNFNTSDYPGCPSASCIFIKYNEEGLFQRNLFNLQIYNAVAFLWCVNFIIALGQCTLAGAFASYYWAFNKPKDIPYFPLSASFIRSLRWVDELLSDGHILLQQVCPSLPKKAKMNACSPKGRYYWFTVI